MNKGKILIKTKYKEEPNSFKNTATDIKTTLQGINIKPTKIYIMGIPTGTKIKKGRELI